MRELIQRHLAAKVVEALQASRIVNVVGPRLVLFETKEASTVSQADFKPIDWFLERGPGRAYAARSVAFVVYLGDKLLTMGPGKICSPLSMVWSFA